jgi:triosephosphate isomerase
VKRKIRNKIVWAVVNASRLLLSVTFILSGTVKLIDPRGTEYKIQDYLAALGLGDTLFASIPLLLAVLFSACEFVIGIYMLFGIQRRLTSTAMILFLSFMTPLTLYLAVVNPITDCGCFGDAIKLTNWQTFGKNVVLFAAAILVLRYYRLMRRAMTRRHQWTVSIYSWTFAFVFAFINLYYLPIVDFRPYHIGADLKKALTSDVQYVTTFILEKDGVQREFTLEEYPDSTWTFIDSKTTTIGEESKNSGIETLQILSVETGEDITPQVIMDPGYVFLLVAPYLEKADDSMMERLISLHDYCVENSYQLLCLTSSGEESIAHWIELTGAEYPFCYTDAEVLKTMVRSNPGLMLLHNGVVVNKWSQSSIPGEEELTAPVEELPAFHPAKRSLQQKALRIFLWYILPLILFALADNLWVMWKLRKLHNFKPFKNKLKMRKKIVAGNWKMNKTLQEGVALATELKDILAAEKPNCEVIIGTPFIHLATVSELLKDSVIAVSAENCANKESGAYTGEVSAAMVKSTGAEYVILGHSERREYYNETPEILKEKVDLALANGLKVIFCIGESLAEREANKQEAVCKAELAGSVFHLTAEQWKNVVIAYEPIWAIGTGKTATAEQAEEIHAYIRSCVAEVYGAQVADETSILYGGSCKASNAPELFAKPDIDGGLIGGASLKAPDFKGIIDAWK